MVDLDLSRRAMAAGFRWAPGMRTTTGLFVVAAGDYAARICDPVDNITYIVGIEHLLPDFNDPSTLSCLENQVREKHGQSLHVVIGGTYNSSQWKYFVYTGSWFTPPGNHLCIANGTTRAEALISALEKSNG